MNRLGQSCILLAVRLCSVQLAQAHESRPAYLEVNETTRRTLRRSLTHAAERRHASPIISETARMT